MRGCERRATVVTMRLTLPRTNVITLLPAFALGAMLRMLYAAKTPYWIHAYDWQGHQQYVLFLTEYGHLPSATFGWETFQPPLFYGLAALWMTTVSVLGWGYGSLQILSVIISLLTLAVGLWIGTLIWKHREDSAALMIYGLLVAACPALVYQASQITNDGLSLLLAVLLIGLLLRWHETQRLSHWILLSVVAGLGLLTKSSALLLLPVVTIAVLCAPRLLTQQKTKLLLTLALVITIVAGWFFVLRFGIEGQTSLVGNSAQIHESLKVPRRIKDVLVFNPVSVVLQPFVDDLVAPRREYLFEHTFRSALFGHRYVEPLRLASLLAFSALGALLLACKGMTSKRMPERMVLGWTVLFMLAGAVTYRYFTPSIANAHIRFVLPILIPLSVFAVHGATMLADKNRPAGYALLGSVVLLSTAVILRLSF